MTTRLICYDISDDKMRTKLAKKLLAWGCERWQYSVFCGTHNPTQWKKCWAAIQHILTKYGKGDEKILVLIISPMALQNMQAVGEKPDLEELLNQKITLWV